MQAFIYYRFDRNCLCYFCVKIYKLFIKRIIKLLLIELIIYCTIKFFIIVFDYYQQLQIITNIYINLLIESFYYRNLLKSLKIRSFFKVVQFCANKIILHKT